MIQFTKENEKSGISHGFSNFGFSTILLSFVMICVVTFSALSLITAHSDYKLSKKVADKTQNYYEAQERAYEKIATIDHMLVNIYLTSTDKNNYYATVKEQLTEHFSITNNSGEYTLVFEETIDQKQYLSVKLKLNYPMASTDYFFEITEWISINQPVQPTEQHLNVMQ